MDPGTTRTVQMPSRQRAAPVASIRAETRTVTVMWSAGASLRRYDWWDDEYFIEQLDMSAEAVDLTRLASGAPVLNTHSRRELEDVIGVVERAWLEDGKGYATLRFSERADVEPYWQDIRSGIIRNVSVGYEIQQMDEAGRDKETGYRILRATKWQPFELSMVPVGADAEAGTRTRSASTCQVNVSKDIARKLTPPAASAAPQGAQAMSQNEAGAGVSANTSVTENNHAAAIAAAAASAAGIDPVQIEKDRKSAIDDLCTANKLDAQIRAHWVNSGASWKQIGADLLRILEERGKDNPKAVADIGLTKRELEQYSLFRMIGALMPNGDKSKAGFEIACHNAVAQNVMAKLGRAAHAQENFFVPGEVLRSPQMMAKRDIVAGTGSAGGFLVETANVGFIELLRNRSVIFNMGARRLSGLTGNVSVPRQTAGATAGWMSTEAGAGAALSDQTFGQLALTPKTVVAATQISRQLQLQSDPSAEGIVMSDLAQQVALAVDTAGLQGSGASGQPTGIINTGGIGGFTGTAITYALLLDSQTDLAVANTLAPGCGYVSHPASTTILLQRQRFTSTDTPLWTGNMLDGQCLGFRGMTSNQMPASRLLFGDFSQVVVAEWGVLELAVNPVANFLAGIIAIRAMYSVDIGVRYAGAFSYSSNNVT